MKELINTSETGMLIRRPVQEVFEAFINPEITTKFWFTHSSGKLEEGVNRIWTWGMYNLNVPVIVKELKQNKTIIIEWGEGKEKSVVKWEFKSLSQKKTYVTITNYEFQGTSDEIIRQVIDSTGGFTLVVAGLKAWLEHKIQLNLVVDKFPKELMNN